MLMRAPAPGVRRSGDRSPGCALASVTASIARLANPLYSGRTRFVILFGWSEQKKKNTTIPLSEISCCGFR